MRCRSPMCSTSRSRPFQRSSHARMAARSASTSGCPSGGMVLLSTTRARIAAALRLPRFGRREVDAGGAARQMARRARAGEDRRQRRRPGDAERRFRLRASEARSVPAESTHTSPLGEDASFASGGRARRSSPRRAHRRRRRAPCRPRTTRGRPTRRGRGASRLRARRRARDRRARSSRRCARRVAAKSRPSGPSAAAVTPGSGKVRSAILRIERA